MITDREKLVEDMRAMGMEVDDKSTNIDLHSVAQHMYLVLMHRINKETNKENDNK